MSVIVGVNAGQTSFGKPLKDGSVCLYKDGNLIGAIPEERLSRKKHDGGFDLSLQFLLTSARLKESDIDLIVNSSCCEPLSYISPTNVAAKQELRLNHHLSHAYNAFKISSFEEALVIVIDAGGNVLEDRLTNTWWKQKREQHSYFLANKREITLIDRDCENPLDTGIGELMRAFTYFLGWPSGTLAGNTMAAGKVIPKRCFEGKEIFNFEDGKIISPIENKPYEPVQVAANLIEKLLAQSIEANQFYHVLEKEHYQIANWVQWNIESILCNKIEYLVEKTGINHICFSGGVAYNCPSISAIRKRLSVKDIFVSWTSGDHGQAIGNALYGVEIAGDIITNACSPYTGGKYNILPRELEDYIAKNDLNLIVTKPKRLADEIVESLQSELAVAVFSGRSESGPRALGNRSIIAKASKAETVDFLNKIKSRMSFMPVAPAVLQENLSELFESEVRTPYMTETHRPLNDVIIEKYPAAFHSDSSARVQTVGENDHKLFREILKKLEMKYDEKMILNTSFNLGGQPIVETPQEAIDTMVSMGITTLYLNEFKITSV